MDLQQIKATAQAAAAEGASMAERRRFYTAITPQRVLQGIEQWDRATCSMHCSTICGVMAV